MDPNPEPHEPAPIVSSVEDAEALWFSGALLKILADGERTGGRFAIVDSTFKRFRTIPGSPSSRSTSFAVKRATTSGSKPANGGRNSV